MQETIINPAELYKALEPVLRKRPGVIIISVKRGRFSVADAKYQAIVAEIPCSGSWRGSAEVSTQLFKKVLGSLLDKELVQIEKESQHLTIKSGTFSIELKRLDPAGKDKTKRLPLPHKGKVIHPPAPKSKPAPHGETWGFSARVPLPAEAYKNRHKE